VVRGWTTSPDGRHHGAYTTEAARALGVPPDGFLDFSANINPLGAPETALKAAHNALREEIGTYPDLEYTELRASLADYLAVPGGTVLPTNGGAEALFLVARAVVEGTEGSALVLEPTFSEYAAVARRPEDEFRLDFDILDKALEDASGVRLVFICNPNNPTGEALSRAEVLRAAERVRGAGAILVVDEAFADFAPDISVADEVCESLYVARSFTKFFAVPGLRLGCLVSHDVEHVRAFQPSWPVNAVAAAVGIAATREEGFKEATLSKVEAGRGELLRALGTLKGITVYPGAANFLLARGPEWLPLRLARRGILVRGCEPFVGLGPGFFRVAVRGAEENGRLIAALRDVLRETAP
jgi:threonine-phosphate decarboxylase